MKERFAQGHRGQSLRGKPEPKLSILPLQEHRGQFLSPLGSVIVPSTGLGAHAGHNWQNEQNVPQVQVLDSTAIGFAV